MDSTSQLADYGAQLVQEGITYATATASQKIALDALNKAQQMIQGGMANFANIKTPTYNPTDLKSTQVGRSELGDIQNDPQGRAAEQQAMAELQKLADNGGLSLADMKAVNDIQQNLNQNASARDKSLQNSYAARGQLGGGAQLAMELNQNQQAGQRANQEGESVAAQAQARALAAIKEKAGLGRQMSQDEYEKKAKAAQANDLIKQHNIANSMQANDQNNKYLNTAFGNDIDKARGQANLITAAVTNARDIGAQGQAGANAWGQLGGQLAGTGGKIATDIAKSGSGSGGGSGTDSNPDSTGGRGGAADLTGGHADTDEITTGGTAIDDYENPYGGY